MDTDKISKLLKRIKKLQIEVNTKSAELVTLKAEVAKLANAEAPIHLKTFGSTSVRRRIQDFINGNTGSWTASQVAEHVGIPANKASVNLHNLTREGKLRKLGWGQGYTSIQPADRFGEPS